MSIKFNVFFVIELNKHINFTYFVTKKLKLSMIKKVKLIVICKYVRSYNA